MTLYGLFLTPAFIEPTDLVVSTAWLVAATTANIPIFIIMLWIISGYLALIIGVALLGHSIIRHLPTITAGAKNPVALIILVVFIVSVVYLWFYYVS